MKIREFLRKGGGCCTHPESVHIKAKNGGAVRGFCNTCAGNADERTMGTPAAHEYRSGPTNAAAVKQIQSARANGMGVMKSGIRNYVSKDGPMHDPVDNEGGPGTVKECPECGETYTSPIEQHVHKSMGIRAHTGGKGIRAHIRDAVDSSVAA